MINENVIKVAHRLFLLLIAISIILLAPWPQSNDDSLGSLLEWISAHLSHKSNSKHAGNTSHNYHTTGHKHSDKNNISSLFIDGLARGLYDVGIVLVAWFTFMCLAGGACRAYLCMEECWRRRFYSVLPLYRVEGDDGDTHIEEEELSRSRFSMGEMVREVVERETV